MSRSGASRVGPLGPAASRVRVCLAFWTGAGGERASRWSAASDPCPRARTSSLVVPPTNRLCSWTATGPHGVAAWRSSVGESSSRFLLWRLRSDCSSPASPRSGWARCSCFCRPRCCVSAAAARRCRPSAGRWRPAAAGLSRSHAAARTLVRARSVRWRAVPPTRAATAPSGSGGSQPTPPSAVQPLPGDPAGGQRRRSSRCAWGAASSRRRVRSRARRARPRSAGGNAAGRCFDERGPPVWPVPGAPCTSLRRSCARRRGGCPRSSTSASAGVSSDLCRREHPDHHPAGAPRNP